MPLILPARTLDSGFNIDNSLRFNDDDNPYLAITPSSSGSRTIATVSFWVKRGNLGSKNNYMLEASSSTSPFNMTRVRFNDDDLLVIDNTLNGSASNGFMFQSNAKYRDPSAWYHIFFSIDVTQANATDGWLLYVNGVQQTKALSFWTQNANLEISQSGVQTNVGRRHDTSAQNFDGYLAEYHYIDGTRKLYTDFGEFNDNGVWIPKKYDGGSYGTNGFYLEFQQTGTGTNASGMGADTSGNTNHFAVNNLTATDQTTDTATNNFCTMMPIATGSRATFTEGNTKISTNVQGSVPYGQVEFGNFFVNKGKWYYEVKIGSVGSGGKMGLGWNERYESGNYTNGHNNIGSNGNAFYSHQGDIKIGSGSDFSTGVDSYTTNDIIGCAIDLDNNKVYWHKNGNYQDDPTPNPASNNGRSLGTATYNNTWTPWVTKDDTNHNITVEFNFGNPPFAISSGNSDDNGFGNFEYDVPTGFYSLCTKNLAEYG